MTTFQLMKVPAFKNLMCSNFSLSTGPPLLQFYLSTIWTLFAWLKLDTELWIRNRVVTELPPIEVIFLFSRFENYPFSVLTFGPPQAPATTGRTHGWATEASSTTRRLRGTASPTSPSRGWWGRTVGSTGAGWTTRSRPPGTPGSSWSWSVSPNSELKLCKRDPALPG